MISSDLIKKLSDQFKPLLFPIEGDIPRITSRHAKVYPVSKDNFHIIRPHPSAAKIAFIDGGNAEIIGSANFSLSFIRIYSTVYCNNKRVFKRIVEGFLLAESSGNDETPIFSASFFPFDDREVSLFSIFADDPSLGVPGLNIEIQKIPELARRILELKMAEGLVEELGEGGIICLDGSLRTRTEFEKELLDSLYTNASKNNVLVTSISKTSRILTKNNRSLSSSLLLIGPKEPWYYCPIADINDPSHRAELFCLKLHDNSKFAFVCELFSSQKNCDIEKYFSILRWNSSDPSFLGYPYGLIEADHFARVTNHEKKYFESKVRLSLGLIDLDKGLSSVSAHEVLDKMAF